MNQNSTPYPDGTGRPLSKVLAVVEPDSAEEVIGAALDVSRHHGATLNVLTCLEPPRDLDAIGHALSLQPGSILERMREQRRRDVAECLARLMPSEDASLHVSMGRSFIEVIRYVAWHDIDLVIKAAEPIPGLQRFLFGSTDQHLLRKCPSAVWLIAPASRRPAMNIVAAVDIDDWDAAEPETLHNVNRHVVDAALQMATDEQAVVHVLHAWDALGESLVSAFATAPDGNAAAIRYVHEVETACRSSMNALLHPYQEAAGAGGPRIVPVLARGPARTVIPAQAEALKADIIVLGTIARTGLSGVIIGNTAEDILNSVSCSVVAVKPDSFVSPVAPETDNAG